MENQAGHYSRSFVAAQIVGISTARWRVKRGQVIHEGDQNLDMISRREIKFRLSLRHSMFREFGSLQAQAKRR